jgi:hypothetical protein
MKRFLIRARDVAIVAIACVAAAPSTARAVDVTWGNTGVDDYNNIANWSTGELPTAAVFNERGVINNGGTAVLMSPNGANPGGILLGAGGANSGTLEIGVGGVLQSNVGAPVTGAPVSGYIEVGGGGTGTLRVLPGGTLQAPGLIVGGATASSMTLGGAGAGTAAVTIDGPVTLGRNARLAPNATLTTTGGGQLSLSPTSRYTVEVSGAGNAKPNVAGPLTLGGTLSIEFNGVTPTAASTWNLFEAASISGAFSSISLSQNIPLAAWQRWTVRDVPAAGGRRTAQLGADQVLVLRVDRVSGVVSLSNPGGAAAALDSYSVQSASGRLLPGAFNSLDDQNAQGGDWLEANPTINRLSELKTAGVTTLTSGATQALGAAFNLSPPAFGVNMEDLTFNYSSTDGVVREGNVQYLGEFRPNNLLLTIDPATGAAQLTNTSTYTVAIDSYSVLSTSGALNAAGWSSLDDQNAAGGDWLEANPTANRLTELKAAGVTTLPPNTSYSLGSLFTTSGLQDLTFEFLLQGGQTATAGVVQFASIALPGDFDGDGDVDGVDLTHPTLGWKARFGNDLSGADFLVWQRNLGAGAPAAGAAASVPEPRGAVLIVLAAASLALLSAAGRRQRIAA